MSAVIDGESLRALRMARGRNQKTLAQAAGVAPSVVSRLECKLQDDTNASILVALAITLGVTVDALLVADYRPTQPDLAADLSAVLADVARLPPGSPATSSGNLKSVCSHATNLTS